MHKYNNTIVLSSILATCITTGAVHAADSFVFDPDGKAGTENPFVVVTFDWSPGNALAENAVPIKTYPDETAFTQYFQASLANFIDPASKVITTTGLNEKYEITIVSGAGEIGFVDGSKNTAYFSQDKENAINFVRIYADKNMDSDALSGTGYDNGELILAGVTTSVQGAFTPDADIVDPLPLDEFGTNDYPVILTAVGVGGSPQTVSVTYYNPDYFPEDMPESLSFNTNLKTPFGETNPSQQFTDENGDLFTTDIGFVNGAADGGGADFLFQADANNSFTLSKLVVGECRMTGGGVTDDGEIIMDEEGIVEVFAEANDATDHYTFGGQIGAPSASQPTPYGEWTHHQFKGDSGKFVFRAGTHSAPPETKVLMVSCNDPGFCNPARPAPFKQLDWEGIGSFKNVRGLLKGVVIPDNRKNFTLHYVRVHYEDIGEPGPGGKQPHSEECTHKIGDPIDESLDCSNCADVYQIEIHATEDPASSVIYSVGGFIDNGNIQLHPTIK